jgi:lysozyme
MGYVQGVDVSHWQPEVIWPELYRAGYRFAFIKATQGTGWRDGTFARKWDEAKRAGFVRSAYHFWINEAWEKQYDNLMRKVGDDPGELPVMLDVEIEGVYYAWLWKMAEKIRATTGRYPLVYSSARYWKDRNARWKNCGLFLADWTPPPDVVSPWTDWDFWQYTVSAKGEIPGVPGARCDLDWFNGDAVALSLYASGAQVEPPVEPPPVVVPDGDGPLFEVITDELNVRNAPRLSGSVVRSLRRGERVRVLNVVAPYEAWIEIAPGQFSALAYNGWQYLRRVE